MTTLHEIAAGSGPSNGLTLGSDGNFYGTTLGILPVPNSGSVESPGIAFRITPAGKLTIYNVFAGGTAGTGQIQHPTGTLALGSDGNFYGTSWSARATVGQGASTVFQLTPAGALTTLDDDVDVPNGGLVQASDGSFYGTDQHGGADHSGSVFKVTTSGAFTTLYSFTDFSDGGVPTAPLVPGGDGNFYGTTSGAATESHQYTDIGTLFQITPAGALTTLATYAYGSEPIALVAASDGNLYYLLGNTVFRSTLDGAATALYTFKGGSDGASPATLVQAADGDFFGTTATTVFRLTLAGGLTTLCAFTGDEGPSALVQGGDGNFYGTSGGITGPDGIVFKVTVPPTITSAAAAAATVGQVFSYQITASDLPTSFAASGLPAGLSVDPAAGLITGTPMAAGTSTVNLSAANDRSGSVATATLSLVATPSGGYSLPPFFTGEAALGNGVYYLAFPNGNPFGEYSFLNDPDYVYHFDLGYEYVLDANDGQSGVYFYDFASSGFFYTSPGFPFPYLYDFTLHSVVYYYPDPNDPGHYNTDGVRCFYVFDTGQIISK